MHDALPSVGGSISATLLFPSPNGTKDPGCAGFLVGGVGGSFHPGANSFQAWEVCLSPSGFLRLAAHDNSFVQLKQVSVAVPAGQQISLAVQVDPVPGKTAVALRVSVNGTIFYAQFFDCFGD